MTERRKIHCSQRSSVRLASTSPPSAGNPYTCSFCGCARRCPPRRTACTSFFRGCAHRCSPSRIACARFLCGCARRCSTHRIACNVFFRGYARRCSPRRIACTCFLHVCGRRCLIRRIACTGSCGGCAGTLRALSSQQLLLPPSRPLPPHAAPSLLPRAKDAFSSPQPTLPPCLEPLPACVWSLYASCLSASHLPPHLAPPSFITPTP